MDAGEIEGSQAPCYILTRAKRLPHGPGLAREPLPGDRWQRPKGRNSDESTGILITSHNTGPRLPSPGRTGPGQGQHAP